MGSAYECIYHHVSLLKSILRFVMEVEIKTTRITPKNNPNFFLIITTNKQTNKQQQNIHNNSNHKANIMQQTNKNPNKITNKQKPNPQKQNKQLNKYFHHNLNNKVTKFWYFDAIVFNDLFGPYFTHDIRA